MIPVSLSSEDVGLLLQLLALPRFAASGVVDQLEFTRLLHRWEELDDDEVVRLADQADSLSRRLIVAHGEHGEGGR